MKVHTEDSSCECSPSIEIVNGEMLIIHNAFDGREGLEIANEILEDKGMSGLTTNRNDPGINKEKPNGQYETYLILSDDERAKGFIRPVRTKYIHVGKKAESNNALRSGGCGVVTTMALPIAEDMAHWPIRELYGYCQDLGVNLSKLKAINSHRTKIINSWKRRDTQTFRRIALRKD